MIGEISLFGVFIPTLLLLGVLAAAVTLLLTPLVNMLGLYRFFAYRALVDLCLFILLLGLFAWLSSIMGTFV
ncbi:DUF1656 domain-containing protein [Novosphingobium sp. 9]|uniref:DUF1656 domain-containing protein n=1 Tax=Novosphingobium sp. 9 TaxID=2025349 RepID=UPI0021B5E92B|nr:DUF1656 domain-containing protein [Novosphingobium sp. 9]